jgi:RNA polymerase sigma-70 factor (ECF subfamily)
VDETPSTRAKTLYDAGAARWPTFTVDPAVFATHLTEETSAEHAADLYLAAGCHQGLSAALAAFHEELGASLEGAIRRLDDAAARGDAKQSLLELLFVGPGRKIATYRGKAPLVHWLRVVASREVRRFSVAENGTDLSLDQVLEELSSELDVGRSDSPEERLRRGQMVELARQAFVRAVADLDPAERSLLRLHAVEKLSIDRLADLLGLHRATVARRIAVVRDHLATRTIEGIAAHAKMAPEDVASALRSVRSAIDLSFERIVAGCE